MCLASEYLSQIQGVFQEVEKKTRELNHMLSTIDKEISDVYHDLETRSFNAVEGYYIAKNIQGLVRRRRLVKHEIQKMGVLQRSFVNSKQRGRLKQVKGSVKQTSTGNKSYTAGWNLSFSEIEEDILH